MDFIIWIILGAIAGWIASIIMKTDGEQNLIGDIIVGILGAVVGGVVMNMFGAAGTTGFNFYSLFVAILGAVIVLAIYKALTRRHV